MRIRQFLPLILLGLSGVICWGLSTPATAQTEQAPLVRVMILHSPSCPHCMDVFNKVIDPLRKKYGDGVTFRTVDVTGRSGRELYRKVIEQYDISPARQAIPMLVVGEIVLVGDEEINRELPRLIEAGMIDGGVAWPNIQGFEERTVGPSSVSPTAVPKSDKTEPSNKFTTKPLGWLVFLSLVGTSLYAGIRTTLAKGSMTQRTLRSYNNARTWIFVIACSLGFSISLYLLFLDSLGLNPNCANLGACSMFREIDYTRIAGIPIAFLGILNYPLLGLLWLAIQLDFLRKANIWGGLLIILLIFAAVVSIILTGIELFVLQTTCILCLGSGMAVALLCLLAVTPDLFNKKVAV